MEIEQKSSLEEERAQRIRGRLRLLYGPAADAVAERLFCLLLDWEEREDRAVRLWNEQDVVLIAYGDSVQAEGVYSLEVLREFAVKNLREAVSTIHLLPFYPWSSDDGFSVIDYKEVNPDYGTWAEVDELGREFRLMFDLVLNHCSVESSWFKNFLEDVDPGRDYFLSADPSADLSEVVRPRSSPLLTAVNTRGGKKWVWTTFSADQVDLNWGNPEVLLEFIDVVLFYLSHGARIIRLDAVAFLWKEPGTDCLHRPETHEIIKLIRDVLDSVSPGVTILTETNVPHRENISYFGNGDEAQMVYNFTLPPLLLHALMRHDAAHLTSWARNLPELEPGKAFLNFTASHDGIGVRPLQGILEEKEVGWLVEEVVRQGGLISTKRDADGSESPYEMNITYLSALMVAGDEALSANRFLCSQAVALALKGVPAVYANSLFGTQNWTEGVAATKQSRAINRRRYDRHELDALLQDPGKLEGRIFQRYRTWLERRREHPAFHPDAPQRILDLGASLFALERSSCDGTEEILCLFNFTPDVLSRPCAEIHPILAEREAVWEILTDASIPAGPEASLVLRPYQPVWLVISSGSDADAS